MEDEKWQDQFAPEGAASDREGYKPFDNESEYKSFNRAPHEGRRMRPRIQRA